MKRSVLELSGRSKWLRLCYMFFFTPWKCVPIWLSHPKVVFISHNYLIGFVFPSLRFGVESFLQGTYLILLYDYLIFGGVRLPSCGCIDWLINFFTFFTFAIFTIPCFVHFVDWSRICRRSPETKKAQPCEIKTISHNWASVFQIVPYLANNKISSRINNYTTPSII